MERIFTYGEDFSRITLLNSGIQIFLKNSNSIFIPLRGISCIEVQNNKDLLFELNSGSVIKILDFSKAVGDLNRIIIHFETWKIFTVKANT